MDNNIEKIGIDIKKLKTIAALDALSQEERAHQISKSAEIVESFQSMIQTEKVFAELKELAPMELDQLIQKAVETLETLKIQTSADNKI